MKVPLQITFRNIEPSAAMGARIGALAQRLEKFSSRITSCRVVVESSSHRRHQGTLFRVRVIIALPRREISTGNVRPRDHAHEDPYVALRDAFDAARRKLEDHVRKQRPKPNASVRRSPYGRIDQ